MAEETITVSEYIAEQERLEKEAKELFPKKFDVCTSSLGYIRQPVYACLTCNPTEEAGMCYSCSISCHGDHNLVELFTKRHFRCDCGTEKFKTMACKLDPKTAGHTKSLNQYNHNYLGRFCWCDVQYDPAKEESTMFQCVLCEDWFHDTCIGITPHADDFDDFICRDCTKEHPFLRRYAQNALFMIGLSKKDGGPKAVTMVDCSKDSKGKAKASGAKDDESEVDITTTTSTTPSAHTPEIKDNDKDSKDVSTLSSTTITTTTITSTTTTTTTPEAETTIKVQVKRSIESADIGHDKENKDEEHKRIKLEGPSKQDCKLKEQPEDAYPDLTMSLFASEGWRDLLCQCSSCTQLYILEACEFITGEEEVYEDEDDDEAETSILESGMKKLNEMDRVQMMEGMLAYSKMRDEIRDFLAPFSEQGKTVTQSDIQAFFAAKMEQRAAAGAKPNFF
ncbi:hypothetical protein MVEG_09923 [Podila verticillata NRRL 6337]|nr:hypothetical protein MVEG_09923 [Podila verticillata NRRL 6337]